jgi:anti-sigma regulatory factor (Ser/Thr protein kinase)
MKPILESRTAIKNESGKEFTIKLERQQLAKLSQLLITQQYANPLTAALREIISNAYDANNEVAPGLAVDITIEKDRVVIRDHGPGLSDEQMHGLYTHIGESTKEDNANAIGAYGVGRLAPLAFSKQFYIRSFHGGYETLYLCNLNEYHIPELTVWSGPEPVPADNTGLEVTIPTAKTSVDTIISNVLDLTEVSRYKVNILKGESFHEDSEDDDWWFNHNLEEFKCWSLPIKDNKGVDITVDFYLANRFSGEYLVLDLGGALYPLNRRSYYSSGSGLRLRRQDTIETALSFVERFRQLSTESHYIVVIRVPPGYLPLNTSREELLDNDLKRLTLESVKQLAYEALTEVFNQEIGRHIQKAFDVYIKNVDELDNATTLANTFFKFCCKVLAVLSCYRLNNLTYTVKFGEYTLCYKGGEHAESTYPEFLYEGDTKTINLLHPHATGLKSYQDNNNDINASWAVSKFYILAHEDHLYRYEDDLCKELRDNYVHHRIKAVPKGGTKINRLKVLGLGLTVVATRGQDVTLKQLERVYKERVDGPILVLKLANGEASVNEIDRLFKSYGALINYLGVYSSPKSKPTNKSKKDEVEAKTGVNLAVLMRQLRNTSKDYIPVGSWAHVHTVENLDDINEALLSERIIYLESDNDHGFISTDKNYKCVAMAPRCFIKHYHPFRFTVSSNAADKITTLRQAGLCNWVSIQEVRQSLFEWLESKHSADILDFAGDSNMCGNIYPRIRMRLGRFIPVTTKRIADWSPEFRALCEEYRRIKVGLHRKVEDSYLLMGDVIWQYRELVTGYPYSYDMDKSWQLLDIINELETLRATAAHDPVQ